MTFKERLEQEQNIAYKTLYNSFNAHKETHAYLISGSKGSPLKELALFIAQSLICKEDVLACESCIDCKKIKNGNYADLTFVNGKEENILKDDIEKLKDEFSLTAVEENGKKIYIIHLIENANLVAVNKLLKFIEEPSNDIYGILTTRNLERVLPTIVSRCQLIRLKPASKDELISKLKEEYDEDTSKLLAGFNDSIEEVEDLLKELDLHKIIDLAHETFTTLTTDINSLMYFITKEVENTITSKKEYKVFFEVLQYKIKQALFDEKYKNYQEYFKDILNELITYEAKLDGIMNLNLLIDQLFINILRKGGII